MHRRLGIIYTALFICIYGCSYFEKKKVSSEEYLNQSLESFNWNELDEYPAFENCTTETQTLQRKLCFENTLSSHLYAVLEEAQIVVAEPLKDTVLISFEVSASGELGIKDMRISEALTVGIPGIDSLIYRSLDSLPKLHPAIKRGQEVKSQFQLPIIIQTD